MQIVLEVVEGPHRGRRFTFDGHDHFIVGRARCAHFRLPKKDPYFSRVHFMVEFNPPHCRLVDAGSMNGTRVNGRRVQAADLKDGDLIQAGGTVLKVSFLPPPEPSGAVPPHKTPPPLSAPAAPAAQGLPSTDTYRPAIAEAPAEASAAAQKADEALPVIEGYQITGQLGRGGMGVVYRASRESDRSEVALKVIRPAAAGSEHQIHRFLREANILRQLRHPNIVAFHEMGLAGELIYFAMDYVPGTDASTLLKRDGPLETGRAVRLVCQVLEALQYAHAEGFVHRDVKPANLLVTGPAGYEVSKLADFGLARVYHASPLSGLTTLGDVGGTTPYLPPEQITAYREVNPAADQYATAATLYRLLTGKYLYDFQDLPTEQRMAKILLDEPVPIQNHRPHLPDALAQLIHHALEKDPAARFPDAAAFRDALLPFAAEE